MPIRSASSTSSSWRRNISVCVEFSRGVVVDQMARRILLPPGSSNGVLRTAASWFYGPLRGEFRQSPWFFLLCRSRYLTGDRLEIIEPGMAHRPRSTLICRHGPKRVVKELAQGYLPCHRDAVFSIALGRSASAILRRRGRPENQHVSTDWMGTI